MLIFPKLLMKKNFKKELTYYSQKNTVVEFFI